MNKRQYEEIISKLIHSNARHETVEKDNNKIYKVYVDFGIYRMKWEGCGDTPLSEAYKYIESQVMQCAKELYA